MKRLYNILIVLLISISSFSQPPAYNATVYTSASAGYYFVCPLKSQNTPNAQMILDSAGNLIYYKIFPILNTFDFKLQSNGMISYCLNGQFFLLDSTFTKVDSLVCQNGINTDFHEMQILSNGHYLMLGLETVIMDLSSYNYFHHNGTAGSANASVLCLVIQELDVNKNVVFEWHAKDHFSFDSVDDFWLNDSANVDWTHSNALEMDVDGNILVSSRHFNEITKINRSDSTIMWRFGGKYNEFTFIGDTVPFYGQHDIRRINNGHVTLYDNGFHTIVHGARALEYQLDEINKTAELKWSHVNDSAMESYATGNVQRLQNSNTMINYGVSNSTLNFNVVDSTGAKVFELTFDDTLYCYRAFNYETLPWSLNRPQITCFDSSGTTYLDAGAGYSIYKWNNGSNSQIIPVTATDTFFVFVPYGQGGFISSPRFIVLNMSNPCSTVSTPEIVSENELRLFPNPVHDELTVINSNRENKVAVSDIYISNADGRIVTALTKRMTSDTHSVTFNVSRLETGIYFIRVNNKTLKFIKMF